MLRDCDVVPQVNCTPRKLYGGLYTRIRLLLEYSIVVGVTKVAFYWRMLQGMPLISLLILVNKEREDTVEEENNCN